MTGWFAAALALAGGMLHPGAMLIQRQHYEPPVRLMLPTFTPFCSTKGLMQRFGAAASQGPGSRQRKRRRDRRRMA